MEVVSPVLVLHQVRQVQGHHQLPWVHQQVPGAARPTHVKSKKVASQSPPPQVAQQH